MPPLRVALSACVIALPFAHVASAQSMPLQLDDARVYVPVAIAGVGPTRWFVFDTGAQPTVVDARVADSAGIRAVSAGTTTGAGGGRVAVARAADVRLVVGGVALGPQTVGVAPLDSLIGPSSGRPIPGIVGSRFFNEHVVTLDFVRRTIRVGDPSFAPAVGDGIVVPLELAGGVPFARGWLRTPDGRRIAARFLVDLGAKAMLLVNEHFAAEHGLATAFAEGVVSPLGAGMGGETRYRFVRAPAIGIGDDPRASADSVIVGLSVGGTLASLSYDALLGVDFLARYEVTFDYARRRMILRPRRDAPRRYEFDMSGIFVVAPDAAHRRIEITEVRPGTPGAEAGLRAGDVVVGATGVAADSLSVGRLRDRLRAADGDRVVLTIERAGRSFEATIRLRRVL